MNWSIRNIVIGLIDLTLAVVSFFIGFRILFKFFTANPQTPFVAWVYQVSETFIYPFNGIFPNLQIQAGAVFDIAAIISLLSYILLTYLIISLVDGIFNAIEERRHLRQGHTHPMV